MSTIGSDYSAHRRSVDDLEKDFETAAKRAKQREKMREQKLERNVKSIVAKKDAELESTVQNVKDEYASSLTNQSKSDRIERERLKQSLYDRNGRRAAAIEEAALTDRDRALEAASAAEARSAKAVSDTERYQEARSTAQAERHEKEMEALAESYRKQIVEARGDGGESDKVENRAYKEKLAKEAQAAIKQAREEVMAERRQAKKLAEQTDFVLKDREKKSDFLLNTRLREKDLSMKAELTKNAEAERASRERELQPLREQVMDTAGIQRDAARAKNEARSGAIRELESDWNSKYQNLSQSHDLEKMKLQADNADAERVYGQKLGSFMKESDIKTTQKILNQNSEHRDQMTSAAKEYDRSLSHVKIQAERDKQLSNELLDRERAEATRKQDIALEKQASTYQNTLSKQREAQGSQIKNLERVLNNKNSTDDPGEISAAAEEAVRTSAMKHFDKTFQAEAERNARDREHLAQNYQARLSDAIEDKRSQATTLNRQNMKEQTSMRNEFVQHVEDVEENKRQMLNLAADANSKMSDTTQRNMERGMNEMRRHYEDLIATRDEAAATRFEELRNQSEFEKRTMRREFQANTADLIRKYQKDMAEQAATAQDENHELKGKLDRVTRENDKRLMQALADQARANDQRMAEVVAQAKDRERLASQQHEDELEKVKKANALLLSKKG
jgi:hypothetical protein